MANPAVNGLGKTGPHHVVAFLIPLCGNSENMAFGIQVSILYVKAKSYLLSFGTTYSSLHGCCCSGDDDVGSLCPSDLDDII